MPPTILVYAFEPFGGSATNISQQVLSRLRGDNLQKIIFPVEFKAQIFTDKIANSKPQIIIGLGQYPRGHKIRIERVARNLKKSQGKISKLGKASGLRVSLFLKPDSRAWISYKAGKHVCNFSMYVVLNDPRINQIPYAFLHIPKYTELAIATAYVQEQIDTLFK